MDKLAVLKIQKKREAEARARELGWVDGDVFAPKKYVMTEEEKVNMARDFGYLDAPTACFSIGKTNSAAVWWVWKDPYPEFIPEIVSDDSSDSEIEKNSDDEDNDAHPSGNQTTTSGENAVTTESNATSPKGKSGGFGSFFGSFNSKPAEEKDEMLFSDDQFDADGNLILTDEMKAEKARKEKEREKRRIKKEKARLAAGKKVKPRQTCEHCNKKNKWGNTSCTKCYRPLPKISEEELYRRVEEEKAKAEALLAEKLLQQQRRRDARQARRDHNQEEIDKRLQYWKINRYRKDPHETLGDQFVQQPLDPVSEEVKDEKDLTDKIDTDEYGIWRYKGSITIEAEKGGKLQFLMGELPNDYEYKFTVCAVNGKGISVESPYSNPVMVEAPLPSGWNRFLDEKKKKFYYANLKLNRSMYGRPDHDAYFLDESILLKFNNDEINYLKSLYDEEMLHFNAVIVDRFVDVLYECGEKYTKNRCLRLYKGYAKDNYKFSSWQIFMDILYHVKRTKEQGSLMAQLNKAANLGMALQRAAAGSMLSANDAQRWGNWITEYSAIADKEYYFNKVTKQKSWDLPDEIRFFLPPGLESKLLKIFDYGHIETFKQYYSMLDIDNSGDLSDKEIERLLEAMGVSITPLGLQKLIDVVDGNGNGTIEFDEFCWMMYEMSRSDSDGAFADFNFKLPVMTSVDGQYDDEGRPMSAGLDFSSISSQLAQRTYGDNNNDNNNTTTGNGGVRNPTPRDALSMNTMGLMQPKAPQTPSSKRAMGSLEGMDPTLDATIHSPLKLKPSTDQQGVMGESNGTLGGSSIVPIAPDGTPMTVINDDLETRSNASRRSKSSRHSQRSAKSHKSHRSRSSDRSHKSSKSKRTQDMHSSGRNEARLLSVLGLADDEDENDDDIKSSTSNTHSPSSKQASPSLRSMSPEQAAKMSTAFGNVQNEVTALADDSFGDMQYDLRGLGDEDEYDSDGNLIEIVDEPECPVCGISMTHVQCKVCYAVGYCSRACLKEDLPKHRLVCVEISREEYEAKQQAAKDLEMAAAKKKQETEMKRLEEEEERRIEQMYDEYEDEGGIVLGPNEFIDPLTNEPAQKKKNMMERLSYAAWKYFYKAKALEKEGEDRKVQDRINKRRLKQKLERDGLANRDANSKHGPYCFCGCRAFR